MHASNSLPPQLTELPVQVHAYQQCPTSLPSLLSLLLLLPELLLLDRESLLLLPSTLTYLAWAALAASAAFAVNFLGMLRLRAPLSASALSSMISMSEPTSSLPGVFDIRSSCKRLMLVSSFVFEI